MIVIDKA